MFSTASCNLAAFQDHGSHSCMTSMWIPRAVWKPGNTTAGPLHRRGAVRRHVVFLGGFGEERVVPAGVSFLNCGVSIDRHDAVAPQMRGRQAMRGRRKTQKQPAITTSLPAVLLSLRSRSSCRHHPGQSTRQSMKGHAMLSGTVLFCLARTSPLVPVFICDHQTVSLTLGLLSLAVCSAAAAMWWRAVFTTCR